MSQRMPSSLLYIFPFQSWFNSKSETPSRAFPYDQPPATELLILLSFLFFLNVLRKLADHVLHGGVIAEICVGMVYGAPLAGILPTDWESTFTVLGYLGLIGIVFEGGLSTNLRLLLSNLVLSTLCAATGIVLPVAFSFALLGVGYGYTHLEAFAAGAALSSTSLGTTLMVLNSVSRDSGDAPNCVECVEEKKQREPKSDEVDGISMTHGHNARPPLLQHTRIGTVLISAAVIDDVIGLVLSSVIPALSVAQNTDSHTHETTSITWTVIRPFLSSSLMAMITPLIARFVLRPLFWWQALGERWCAPSRAGKPWGSSSKWTFRIGSQARSGVRDWGKQEHADAVKLAITIPFVSAFSSIAYYTGGSILFGAYLAGLTLTYISRPPEDKESTTEHDETESESITDYRASALSFEEAYGRTIGLLQNHIFAPLFFASIGYAIPFTSLWQSTVIWKGALYALLMAIAKIAVCLPIVLWTMLPKPNTSRLTRLGCVHFTSHRSSDTRQAAQSRNVTIPIGNDAGGETRSAQPFDTSRRASPSFRSAVAPAAFMGIAMVSRGEIGLLIAQIARDGSGPRGGGLLGDEAFLVCMWAILLCTLVGPIGVGFTVRRWDYSIRRGIWG